eukprot:366241-Chlamydomonas_euryale.AAC.3
MKKGQHLVVPAPCIVCVGWPSQEKVPSFAKIHSQQHSSSLWTPPTTANVRGGGGAPAHAHPQRGETHAPWTRGHDTLWGWWDWAEWSVDRSPRGGIGLLQL